MNILLCSLNSKYIHSSLAVWYLYEYARKNCHKDVSVNIFEGTINQPLEELSGQIAKSNADLIAFSCYIWNISIILSIITRLKILHPTTRILLGGPEVSFRPKELLKENPNVDYIIAGEGEYPFSVFLNTFVKDKGIVEIPGLSFRDDYGKILFTPPAPALLEPPDPYSEEYLSSLRGRIAYLETSRGCPFSCAFCLSGVSGARVRFFNLDRAKQNLLLLARSGAQTIKLVDRTFNCDPRRAYDLFKFIINNANTVIPSGVCFHFEVAADLFDAQTLRLLATAPPGLIQLEAGIQTFNPRALAAVIRKTNISKLEENLQKILSTGNIHVHADLIAGLPYEDLPSFSRSFDRAYKLRPHMLQLGFLKLLHGSNLRAAAQKLALRFKHHPPYEVKSTPWLSKQDLLTLSEAEYALDKFYNSGRFSLTLTYLLDVSGIQPFDFFKSSGNSLLALPIDERRSLDALTRQAYRLFCLFPGC